MIDRLRWFAVKRFEVLFFESTEGYLYIIFEIFFLPWFPIKIGLTRADSIKLAKDILEFNQVSYDR